MRKLRRKAVVGLLVALLLSAPVFPVVAEAVELKVNLQMGGCKHQIEVTADTPEGLEQEVFRQVEEQLGEKLGGRYSPAVIECLSRFVSRSLTPFLKNIVGQRPPSPEESELPQESATTPPPEEEPPALPESGEDDSLAADEQLMVNLVNAERKKAGLPELKADMTLVRLARRKSRDMIDNGYFSHYSPTFGSPFDMMREAGISYRYAGENIAGAPMVETAHSSLMNSPGHRANILNPNFTYIGIGVADGGPYGKMFTQMFVGR